MKKLDHYIVYYALITIGIGLIIFPFAKEHYYNWKQDRLLASAVTGNETINVKEAKQRIRSEFMQLSALFEEEARWQNAMANGSPEAMDTETNTAETDTALAETQNQKQEKQQAIAILSIDKIDLKLPVLEGATQQNMRYAAAHMTETAPLGEIGNAAIAAHRARTKGRLFNRLNELEIGDSITVEMSNEKIEYTVFRTKIVKPDDISVLSSNRKDAVLTLITCDPVIDPTHRLIVQAKRI